MLDDDLARTCVLIFEISGMTLHEDEAYRQDAEWRNGDSQR